MTMAWTAIPDSQIAAYEPIDFRLLEAMRSNQFAGRVLALHGCMATSRGNLVADGDAAENTWQDAPSGDIRLWVPEFCAGDNGTTLIVPATLTVNHGISGNSTVTWRLKFGTTYSNEVSHSASGSGTTTWSDQLFTLTFAATSGAFNTITIQDKVSTDVSSPGAQAGFQWESSTVEGRMYAV